MARRLLRETFRSRACCTLPQPLADMGAQEEAGVSGGLASRERTPQWLAAVATLRGVLGTLLVPRRIGGGVLDGGSLGRLLVRAVELLSSPDALRPGASDALSHGIVEAQAERNGGWSTARHVQAPTTDIPVSQARVARISLHDRSAMASSHGTRGEPGVPAMPGGRDSQLVRRRAAGDRVLACAL